MAKKTLLLIIVWFLPDLAGAAEKVLIDTDPGVDDAQAVFFALASEDLEVVGLTTIFGNVETALATTSGPGAPTAITTDALPAAAPAMTPSWLQARDSTHCLAELIWVDLLAGDAGSVTWATRHE